MLLVILVWMRAAILSFLRILEAELSRVYIGLSVAWEGDYRKLVVESNCKDVIDLIYSRATTHSSLSLVLHIQDLLQHSWCVSIHYIPRLLNTMANGLVKMAYPESLEILRFQTPYVALHALLEANRLL
ncbi:hypothetical protein V6N11_014241 [Hibiscus sabdariffa]|uniref:RNase H type-1 domain-containing protein n=2 Tax=Hibiscus sabdariffa TaxID=183260 RepID=A0ABR1ZR44_9ROSI